MSSSSPNKPRARLLAQGSLFLFGSQCAGLVIQLGYAGVASRLVSPSGFGTYAVALTLPPVLGIATNGPIGTAAGRLKNPGGGEGGGLMTVALLIGLLAGLLTVPLAGPWSAVWSAPEAQTTVLWTAPVSLMGPCLAVLNGLAVRLGKVRELSLSRLASYAIGMPAGALIVMESRSSQSLLATTILVPAIQLALLQKILWDHARPRVPNTEVRNEIGYGKQLSVSSIGAYLYSNIPTWGVSALGGPTVMGSWNRAVTLTSVPIEMVQVSITSALLPEMRPRESGKVQPETVSDFTVLTAWMTLGAAAFGAALLPVLVPVLLGPGWDNVTSLGTLTAFWSGAIAPTMVVSGSLEFNGAQRAVRGPVWVCVAVTSLALATAFALDELWPLFVGMFIALGVRHLLHVRAASLLGLLVGRRLVAGYVRVVIGAALVWSVTSGFILAAHVAGVSELFVVLPGLTVTSTLAWRFRSGLPPFVILRAYGIV